MRKALAKQEGVRKKFKAVFTKFGKKINYKGYSETTVLLTRIEDSETGIQVADHLWFAYTAGFEKANLQEGARVEFEARVKAYSKGYVNRQVGINNRRQDYKLSHPAKINVIKE